MTTITAEVNKLWEHNKRMFRVQPRKIVVQRAGAHHRAFFDGGATGMSTFGGTPETAIKLLKFWEGVYGS